MHFKFVTALLAAVLALSAAQDETTTNGYQLNPKFPEYAKSNNKPEAPEAPEAPEYKAPEAPKLEQPEVPKYEKPEAPKIEVPEVPSYEVPVVPKYEKPELPKVEVPEVPKYENPELPTYEKPEVPVVEAPEAPEAPEYQKPELPQYEKPEVPTTYEQPEVPDYEKPQKPKFDDYKYNLTDGVYEQPVYENTNATEDDEGYFKIQPKYEVPVAKSYQEPQYNYYPNEYNTPNTYVPDEELEYDPVPTPAYPQHEVEYNPVPSPSYPQHKVEYNPVPSPSYPQHKVEYHPVPSPGYPQHKVEYNPVPSPGYPQHNVEYNPVPSPSYPQHKGEYHPVPSPAYPTHQQPAQYPAEYPQYGKPDFSVPYPADEYQKNPDYVPAPASHEYQKNPDYVPTPASHEYQKNPDYVPAPASHEYQNTVEREGSYYRLNTCEYRFILDMVQCHEEEHHSEKVKVHSTGQGQSHYNQGQGPYNHNYYPNGNHGNYPGYPYQAPYDSRFHDFMRLYGHPGHYVDHVNGHSYKPGHLEDSLFSYSPSVGHPFYAPGFHNAPFAKYYAGFKAGKFEQGHEAETRQYHKEGHYQNALHDFNNLKLNNVVKVQSEAQSSIKTSSKLSVSDEAGYEGASPYFNYRIQLLPNHCSLPGYDGRHTCIVFSGATHPHKMVHRQFIYLKNTREVQGKYRYRYEDGQKVQRY